jgi:hypothetical protein
MWNRHLGVLLLAATLACRAREGVIHQSKLATAPRLGRIHGIVLAAIASETIPLAGVDVVLRPAAGGANVAVGTTDETGAYMLTRVLPGSYRVCWNVVGYRPGCTEQAITVEGYIAAAPEIALLPDNPNAFLRGRVRLQDGSPCRFSNEFFGVDRHATVRVIDGGVAGRPIRTNAAGDFVLLRPHNENARLRVTCGPAVTTAPATQNAVIVIPGADVIPQLFRIAGVVEGMTGRIVAPGAQLTLRAAVPLSSKVEWKGVGVVEKGLSANGRNASLVAPSEPGLYSVYALAEDARGDVGNGRFDIVVGGPTPAATKIANAFAAGTSLPNKTPTPGIDFLTKKQIGDEATAKAYYKFIDPKDKRTTLGGWWDTVGFSPDGGGGTRTAYMNHNDLGFGRDMNCRERGNDIACYVTNYGSPMAADNADLAFNKTAPAGATVAMEYSTIDTLEGRDPIIKFFVFEPGANRASQRVQSADLDQTYPKFVPQLCLNCHGGDYSPTTPTPVFDDVNIQASFREFDLPTFEYPGAAPRAAQEGNFYLLQMMIRKTKPAGAIVDLIDHWYAAGTTADDSYVPAGWKGDANQIALYTTVVGRSCRTCHVALGGSAPRERSWMTYEQFKNQRGMVVFDVCRQHIMPHAKVTFENFWTASPSRSPVLETFTSAGWTTPVGTCK